MVQMSGLGLPNGHGAGGGEDRQSKQDLQEKLRRRHQKRAMSRASSSSNSQNISPAPRSDEGQGHSNLAQGQGQQVSHLRRMGRNGQNVTPDMSFNDPDGNGNFMFYDGELHHQSPQQSRSSSRSVPVTRQGAFTKLSRPDQEDSALNTVLGEIQNDKLRKSKASGGEGTGRLFQNNFDEAEPAQPPAVVGLQDMRRPPNGHLRLQQPSYRQQGQGVHGSVRSTEPGEEGDDEDTESEGQGYPRRQQGQGQHVNLPIRGQIYDPLRGGQINGQNDYAQNRRQIYGQYNGHQLGGQGQNIDPVRQVLGGGQNNQRPNDAGNAGFGVGFNNGDLGLGHNNGDLGLGQNGAVDPLHDLYRGPQGVLGAPGRNLGALHVPNDPVADLFGGPRLGRGLGGNNDNNNSFGALFRRLQNDGNNAERNAQQQQNQLLGQQIGQGNGLFPGLLGDGGRNNDELELAPPGGDDSDVNMERASNSSFEVKKGYRLSRRNPLGPEDWNKVWDPEQNPIFSEGSEDSSSDEEDPLDSLFANGAEGDADGNDGDGNNERNALVQRTWESLGFPEGPPPRPEPDQNQSPFPMGPRLNNMDLLGQSLGGGGQRRPPPLKHLPDIDPSVRSDGQVKTTLMPPKKPKKHKRKRYGPATSDPTVPTQNDSNTMKPESYGSGAMGPAVPSQNDSNSVKPYRHGPAGMDPAVPGQNDANQIKPGNVGSGAMGTIELSQSSVTPGSLAPEALNGPAGNIGRGGLGQFAPSQSSVTPGSLAPEALNGPAGNIGRGGLGQFAPSQSSVKPGSLGPEALHGPGGNIGSGGLGQFVPSQSVANSMNPNMFSPAGLSPMVPGQNGANPIIPSGIVARPPVSGPGMLSPLGMGGSGVQGLMQAGQSGPPAQGAQGLAAQAKLPGDDVDPENPNEQDMLLQLLELESMRVERNTSPRADQGLHTIIIVDVSGSMEGAPFIEATRFISQFIAGLEEIQFEYNQQENVAVICVGSNVHIAQHFTNNYAIVRDAADTLLTGGPSKLYMGLSLIDTLLNTGSNDSRRGLGGVYQVGSHIARPRVILITDGNVTLSEEQEGSIPRPDDKNMAALQNLCFDLVQASADRTLMRVYCVPIGNNVNMNFLELLSQSTGGRVVQPTDAEYLSRSVLHHVLVAKLKETSDSVPDREKVVTILQQVTATADDIDVDGVLEVYREGEPDLKARDEIATALALERYQAAMKGGKGGNGAPALGQGEPNMDMGALLRQGGLGNLGEGAGPLLQSMLGGQNGPGNGGMGQLLQQGLAGMLASQAGNGSGPGNGGIGQLLQQGLAGMIGGQAGNGAGTGNGGMRPMLPGLGGLMGSQAGNGASPGNGGVRPMLPGLAGVLGGQAGPNNAAHADGLEVLFNNKGASGANSSANEHVKDKRSEKQKQNHKDNKQNGGAVNLGLPDGSVGNRNNQNELPNRGQRNPNIPGNEPMNLMMPYDAPRNKNGAPAGGQGVGNQPENAYRQRMPSVEELIGVHDNSDLSGLNQLRAMTIDDDEPVELFRPQDRIDNRPRAIGDYDVLYSGFNRDPQLIGDEDEDKDNNQISDDELFQQLQAMQNRENPAGRQIPGNMQPLRHNINNFPAAEGQGQLHNGVYGENGQDSYDDLIQQMAALQAAENQRERNNMQGEFPGLNNFLGYPHQNQRRPNGIDPPQFDRGPNGPLQLGREPNGPLQFGREQNGINPDPYNGGFMEGQQGHQPQIDLGELPEGLNEMFQLGHPLQQQHNQPDAQQFYNRYPPDRNGDGKPGPPYYGNPK